jgi:hypothetical protein
MSEQPQQAPPEVASGYVSAGDTVEAMAAKMADDKIRSTLGDWEKRLSETMSRAEQAFTGQQETLQAQIAQLQGQLATVRAQAGPPEALTVARSLADRLPAIAAAHPDLGKLHFAGVIGQGHLLSEAVEAVSKGEAGIGDAERLANGIITWFERWHPRVSGKVLETAGAAVEEAERILALLPELAPAVTAIAAAV